jgi:surface antigen
LDFMQRFARLLPFAALVLLAGCSFGPTTSDVATGPTLAQPGTETGALISAPSEPVVPTTVASTAAATTMNDVTAFIDAGVIGKLGPKDKSEAASAQYNALTFGRPGAPRNWAGDRGVTGQVTVGPYVRVNNIDCRDFTHTVTLSGGTFTKKGTACRDTDGTWSVS